MSVVAALFGGASAPLSATASTYNVWGSANGLTTCTTNSTTISPIGGVPGYTYFWAWESGDLGFAATNGTSATTAFTYSFTNYSEYASSIWRCHVTDTLGQTTTVDVTLSAAETSY